MDRAAYAVFAQLEPSHFWFRSRRSIFFDLLDRALGHDARTPRPGAAPRAVLEIGCGAGGMLGPLQRYGRVTGIDIDHEYVAYCKERGFADVACGSGYELPFHDGAFDLVCLFDTLEHIPDDEQALREVRRVLRPGGSVFVSVPAYQWLWSQNDRTAHHCRRYTRTLLLQRLQHTGFAPRKVSYFNTLLLPLIVPTVLWQKLMDRLGLLPPNYNNMSVPLPKLLNWLFTTLMSSERHLLRWLSLPFGHSVLALAERRADPHSPGSQPS